MMRWRKVQEGWKKPLTPQAKNDIQDIINKHQAGALLEANDTIRALEEQREEHRIILGEQAKTIRFLELEVQQIKHQQQHYEEHARSLILQASTAVAATKAEKSSEDFKAEINEDDNTAKTRGDHDGDIAKENTSQQARTQNLSLDDTADKVNEDENETKISGDHYQDDIKENISLQAQIEDLKRQLQEKDALIATFQQEDSSISQPQQPGECSSGPVPGNDTATTDNCNNQTEQSQVMQSKLKDQVAQLQLEVNSLTEENQSQKDEIEKLQNILKELEEFHALESPIAAVNNASNIMNGQHQQFSFGLETIEESSSLMNDSSEMSETSESDTYSNQNGKSLITLNGSTELSEGESSVLLETDSEREAIAEETEKPYRGMTLQGNQLVLLISSMPVNPIVAANQSRLETVLQGYLNLSSEKEVQVMDGCDRDPASVNLRNDLFRISGLHAQYPQLFLVNFANNDISFVGDFATIMELHDTQTFASTIGLIPY